VTKDHKIYSGIYKITNRLDGKCYIGQSIDILYRWDIHFNNLMKHSHKHKFYDVMWEIGLQNFDWEIIDVIDYAYPPNYDELNRLEIMYIEKYKSFIDDGGGYNMTRGGLSKGCSEETSKKISKKAKERDNSLSLFCNPQFHKEMAIFRKGKPMSISARINMSHAQKGRKVTTITRERSSLSHQGRTRSESAKKKQGLTIKINKLLSEAKGVKIKHDSGTIQYFVSVYEAAHLLGGCQISAINALKNNKEYRPPKRTFVYSYCNIMDVLCNRNDLYLMSQPNAHDKLYNRLS
jgi:group I intron endonuclease